MFSRIRCHFCTSKQPHSKSVREFQCSECEAVNYLDGKGNIVDTPSAVASRATSPPPTSSTQPPPETLDHQQNPAFCRTCLQNQHLYNETLANYLPEESHPQYKAFEAAIPEYKEELARRYPLVCKRCAPQAQSKINRADYYALTDNFARLAGATRSRRGRTVTRTRDNWGKKSMRIIFNLIGLILWLSLAVQVIYHAYGILNIFFSTRTPESEFLDTSDFLRPSVQDCVQNAARLNSLSKCYNYFSTLVPYALAVSVAGLWYNPGLKAWYHHTHRMEAVNGQKNFFMMQLLILAVRSWAWLILSNPSTTAEFHKEQLFAMHAFAIFFMFITPAVANRSIQTVIWKMKGKMMPKPEKQDVFGTFAGPEPENYTPKASEQDPFKYLRKDNRPFDINSLAPQPPKRHTPSRIAPYKQQPSPEASDEEEVDAMETDYRPVMRSSQRQLLSQRPERQPRNRNLNGASLSFNGGLGDEVYDMDSQLRAEQERKQIEHEQVSRSFPPRKEASPFYGQLPPAPMSMERRLRNPAFRPAQPAQVPLSQQNDFMARMGAGIKPVQYPQKGSNFEMKKSEWVLPGDMKEIGIEERFGQSFTLQDPAPAGSGKKVGKWGFLGL
ncbi:Integral inner nuclear membrane protein ima1 [Fulvia fulva]|uniref:Integral inner nuclear membrane protein ima1 n=1 Tax=Passalora fulva TaxID=5499 RepID=A0A9Q8UVP5_PASFU|nr:Integral inner nuclear membrane protein ima1 [Fulvia fulva]KAK4611196.1 Integral inner nuclear membrane protein ima1 [Fulvia fulva]UJO24188.1 Integral inner nuclear membrane protein ima1 [Fulvia fulva]WPV36646.1 Integral inner nuclear membrane protein ima1 [Fulvia fulva]